MYKRVPTQVAVAAFTSKEKANAALDAVTATIEAGGVTATNLAIAKKSKSGKIRVREFGAPGPIKGTLVGGAVGTAIGAVVGGLALLFLGPIGWVAGGVVGGVAGAGVGAVNGAALGSLAALTVKGMDKSKLKNLGSALEPDTEAVVVVFDEIMMKNSEYKEQTKEHGDDVQALLELLSSSISESLKAGQDIAYLVCVGEDGIISTKATVGEDAFNISGLVLTTDAAVAGELKGTEAGVAIQAAAVTKDGAAAGGAVVTDNAAAYEVAAVKNDEGLHEVGVIAADS